MSYELDYFPPNGTKYNWFHKSLNYSPWVCNLSDQKEKELFLFPAEVKLMVDTMLVKSTIRYVWIVLITDFSYNKTEKKGVEKDAISACLRAEKEGEEQLQILIPDWVRMALINGWRCCK